MERFYIVEKLHNVNWHLEYAAFTLSDLSIKIKEIFLIKKLFLKNFAKLSLKTLFSEVRWGWVKFKGRTLRLSTYNPTFTLPLLKI